MKFKDLDEEQQKLGEKLRTMCRYAGYDFEDFVTLEDGMRYCIKSDIIGLKDEEKTFAVYLTKSGVYSIDRYCPTCGFDESVEPSAGMSENEIKDWLKRELDKSYLINVGSVEMEHTCEEV